MFMQSQGFNVGRGRGYVRPTIPKLLSAPSVKNDGTNPTFPTHGAGHLLVSGACNNNTHSGLYPTAGGSWVKADEALASTNRSSALYSLLASAAGQTVSWSNVNIPRVGWAFEHAVLDKYDAFADAGASVTSFTWPSLTALGMASDCIVIACIMMRAAQTSVTGAGTVGEAMVALGFTTRGTRTAAPAYWVGDTNTTLLSAFAPAAQNFDTSTSYAGFVASIKAW